MLGKSNRYTLTEAEQAVYESKLAVSSDEVMGYINIPSIKCTLPIYHGIEEGTLQSGVGHIPGTSLPVGGPGTHCVLSGHRGLPSAKLFTNLDQLVEGDLFMLQVLDETLTYEVDQIFDCGAGADERPGHRRRAGLLHAGHLHALRHQYAPFAGAGPSGRKSVRWGYPRYSRRFADGPSAGSAAGGSAHFTAAADLAAGTLSQEVT